MKKTKSIIILSVIFCFSFSLQAQPNLKVYTIDGCSRCAFTIKYLKDNNIAFTELNTDKSEANDKAMWELLKGKTTDVKMPVIDFKGVIGYNISNLEEYVKNIASKASKNTQPVGNNSNADAVIIFEHGSYRGKSQTLKPGRYDISNIEIGNDMLSSIKVPNGMYALLFEDGNFKGKTREVNKDEDFIVDFNDLTSAIIVGYKKSDPSLKNNYSATISFKGCATGNETVAPQNQAFEKRIFELVNEERRKVGLPIYKWNDKLGFAARYHAADMSQDNYFDHNSYDYDQTTGQKNLICKTFDRIKAFAVGFGGLAENIAKGSPTPEGAMQQWMNSTGHRTNILGSFTSMGVGYINGHWVQVFGNQ